MNKDRRCLNCKYNTPKAKGGEGRICNGFTMEKHNRCPEWVISEFNNPSGAKYYPMSEIVEGLKVKQC